jgi:hypothetical protein
MTACCEACASESGFVLPGECRELPLLHQPEAGRAHAARRSGHPFGVVHLQRLLPSRKRPSLRVDLGIIGLGIVSALLAVASIWLLGIK